MHRLILFLFINVLTAKVYCEVPDLRGTARQFSSSVHAVLFADSELEKSILSHSKVSFAKLNAMEFAPAVPVFVAGKSTVCTGNTGVVYTVTNDPAVTYTWSYSGADVQIVGTTNSVTLNFGNNATSGNVSVIATENGVQSAPASFAVTVNTTPAAPQFLTGFTTVCAGSATVSYSVLNDPTVTYSWNYSTTGAVITGGTTDKVTVFYGATAQSGILQVVATRAGCTSQAGLPISVNPKPATPVFTASALNVCTGATGKIYSVTNDPTVIYSWSYSGTGAVINNSTTNSVTIDYASGATSGTLTVTAAKSGCSSSSSVSVNVVAPPATPTFVTSNPSVCSGALAVPYSVTNVSGLSYTWSYSGTGATINNSTSNSITVDYLTTATPGNLTVTAANSGCSTSANLPIAFNGTAPAKPVFATSTAAVCAGSTGIAYSVTNDPTLTYAWSYSGTGATINNSTTSNVTVDYSNAATPGNLIVTATKNGCSNSSSLAITMSTLPTASFVTAPVSVCAGSTGVVYNVTNDPTVAYAWNYSGTGAVINNSTTNNVILDFSNTATSGNLTVITTKNGCSSSSSVSVTVKSKPAAPTQFSTVQNVVCQGMSGVQYGVAASAGVTYNWSYSGTGVNLNSTTNTVGVDFTGTATSGTLSVKSVLNGCESTPLTTAVTVIPIASTIKPDFTIPSVCASATALFTNTTDPATANISSFAWDFGNGQTATTKNGTATYSTAGVYAVKLTATVTACPSITGSITKNITVLNPTAGIAYDTITAVRGVPVNLSARNIGTTYSWSPVTGLSFPNSASTSLVPTQTQRFLINITAANGCTTVDTQFVQVASKTGLYIPTMFSPNGDGRNDLLAPLPVAITKLNFFRVYNRWGNIVYEQRNTMGAGIGWNGKYKGIDQPVGVYIWVAEGVDIDNKIVRVDGNTVLIR